MIKSDNQFSALFYVVPRVLLWSVCMLYIVITLVTSLDLFEPYMYPLAYLRQK